MDELIKAMSNEQLEALKAEHADNESIVKLVDGILESRANEAEELKKRADFEKQVSKLVDKLPHPEGIHNVYLAWQEVDIPDGEPEEVEVNGEMEVRQASHKEWSWVVTTNKAFKVASGGSTEPKARKNAIKVSKRSEANPSQLEEVGNFTSASKACEHLGIEVGGDSAVRALDRNGYFKEPYDGTDFTA